MNLSPTSCQLTFSRTCDRRLAPVTPATVKAPTESNAPLATLPITLVTLAPVQRDWGGVFKMFCSLVLELLLAILCDCQRPRTPLYSGDK